MGGTEDDISTRALIVTAAAVLAIIGANMSVISVLDPPRMQVADYRDSIADMVPRLAAAAAYPDGGGACHRAAAAEIAGIADGIMLDPYARKEYAGSQGRLALMDAAVIAWLDGGNGRGMAECGGR